MSAYTNKYPANVAFYPNSSMSIGNRWPAEYPSLFAAGPSNSSVATTTSTAPMLNSMPLGQNVQCFPNAALNSPMWYSPTNGVPAWNSAPSSLLYCHLTAQNCVPGSPPNFGVLGAAFQNSGAYPQSYDMPGPILSMQCNYGSSANRVNKRSSECLSDCSSNPASRQSSSDSLGYGERLQLRQNWNTAEMNLFRELLKKCHRNFTELGAELGKSREQVRQFYYRTLKRIDGILKKKSSMTVNRGDLFEAECMIEAWYEFCERRSLTVKSLPTDAHLDEAVEFMCTKLREFRERSDRPVDPAQPESPQSDPAAEVSAEDSTGHTMAIRTVSTIDPHAK